MQAVQGLADVSKEYNLPVVSGNVSFYNETSTTKIFPTVTIGMVGYCNSEEELIQAVFNKDEHVFLIGEKIQLNSNVGASLYQKVLFDFIDGEISSTDYSLEIKLKNAIFEMRKKTLLSGAIDVSKGGVLGTLLCALFNSDIGFCGNLLDGKGYSNSQKLKLLFGEIEGRYLFSTKCRLSTQEYLTKNNIPFVYLGICVGDKIEFDGYEFCLKELKNKYFNAISNRFD